MRSFIDDTILDNIAIKLEDKEIIYTETGTYTVPPSETIIKAERVLQKNWDCFRGAD